jgi:hypothetical protein
MDATRLLAWLGSAIGNASLFGAILTGWPGLPSWDPPLPEPKGTAVIQLGFRPFVDPIFEHYSSPGPGPDCPNPRLDGDAVRLDYAPLPLAYDPFAYWDRLIFACVRVDGARSISSVALIGVEDAGTARALTRTIRNEWRFSPGYESADETGWIRVRLSATAADPGADYFYPL